jgi:hypothetical protein
VRVAVTVAALAEDPGAVRRILDRYAAALHDIGLPAPWSRPASAPPARASPSTPEAAGGDRRVRRLARG